MKCCLFVVAVLIYPSAFSQSDFIQLKKRNKVIDTWFKDNAITLKLTNGEWVDALIYKIQFDSLYLRPYFVQTLMTRLGFTVVDTIFSGMMTININQIKAFPKKDEGFSYVKNGALFKIGSAGYFLLNLINTLSDNQPYFGSKNLDNISIAACVFAIGMLLGFTHSSYYIIGKKYRIEYVSKS